MDKLSGIRYTTLPADSPYVKPFRMYYTQNGIEKSWDMLKVHDSVAIIILNKTRNKLVMVRQFRPGKYSVHIHTHSHQWDNTLNLSTPLHFTYDSMSPFSHSFSAVYHSIVSSDPDYDSATPQSLFEKYPPSLAFTNELCAGIVDKSKSLIEIAHEEIVEECGYNVPIDRIELVMNYR